MVLDSGRTYTGKVVVGADGAYSKVGNAASTTVLLRPGSACRAVFWERWL